MQTMSIDGVVTKLVDGAAHLISGGLFIDSAINFSQGQYELAAMELIGAAYVQVRKHQDKKRRERIQAFSRYVNNEFKPSVAAVQANVRDLESEINQLSSSYDTK